MNDTKQIAYRYIGPAKYAGIPAHDLTPERVSALSLKLQRALDQDGSPYEKVVETKEPAKGKSEETK